MTLLFPIKKNTFYEQDSLTKKARTSLSNFLPSLKRKRSFEPSSPEDITKAKKKKKISFTMTRLFQKFVLSTHNKINHHPSTDIVLPVKEEEETLLDSLCLPTIEPTNGCLGILLKKEDDSIFSTNEGPLIEFPIPPAPPPPPPPPSLPQQKKRKRRLRQGSCPPRLNSLVLVDQSDDEPYPLTPNTTENQLLKMIQNLDIV
ncbi:hypothetical protein BD770DRAFT_440152 [Pilaira anomala]|nr:hypothetical protein BD770DRAFT_440152 [Pilaira anomala]